MPMLNQTEADTGIIKKHCPVEPITRGPRNHYFGYYDKRQFDSSGRYALGLSCGIFERMQQPDDEAELGIVDLDKNNAWIPLCNTRAWNWQFGCLAQWMPGSKSKIIYNDRMASGFVSILLDTVSMDRDIMPHPVFDIHPGGKSALTLNFKRLAHVRPETGFSYPPAGSPLPPRPDDDGLFRLDLTTGRKKLLISLADIAGKNPEPTMESACHYLTHPLWNKDGSRFLFWHRWKTNNSNATALFSRVYTANADGKDIFFLLDGNSHTAWRDSSHVLAWAHGKDRGAHYYLHKDRSEKSEIIGENILRGNGHGTFSPDSKWLLTDTPPDANKQRAVLLYRWNSGQCFEAGRFATRPGLEGELRCDPHPRFHPGGSKICIDSAHEGARQMYVIDVSRIINSI